MKFGFRTPSLKKSFAARTSFKRMVRSKIRAPRGMGIITNPKRALYNKAYNRTSISINQLGRKAIRKGNSTGSSWSSLKLVGYLCLTIFLIAVWPLGLIVLAYLIYKYFFKSKKNEVIPEPLVKDELNVVSDDIGRDSQSFSRDLTMKE
jgi:hypothetical protein